MTNKQRYFYLQAEVCELLPPYAVDMAIRAGYGQQYESVSRRLSHVKQGKVVNLPDLIALVEAALPTYAIPAHLRPEPSEQVPAAATTPLFQS